MFQRSRTAHHILIDVESGVARSIIRESRCVVLCNGTWKFVPGLRAPHLARRYRFRYDLVLFIEAAIHISHLTLNMSRVFVRA